MINLGVMSHLLPAYLDVGCLLVPKNDHTIYGGGRVSKQRLGFHFTVLAARVSNV